VLAYLIPGDVIAATTSAVVVAIVALAVALARVRERVTRLEEWVRQAERRNGLGP